MPERFKVVCIPCKALTSARIYLLTRANAGKLNEIRYHQTRRGSEATFNHISNNTMT